MRPLRLDLLHPRPRAHWAAWLLLAAGAALAGWTAWQDVQTRQALAEAVAAAPRPSSAAPAPLPPAVAGDAQTAARQARAQLATPWDALFVRLEANLPKGIALLALEADARKTEATLTAEARSARDMLDWVEQLRMEAGFATVALASHALQENDPQRPLRFVVRLDWRN